MFVYACLFIYLFIFLSCSQDFKHEVNLLIKLRHPNIVQFLGAVTETKPLMLITEFLRGVCILLCVQLSFCVDYLEPAHVKLNAFFRVIFINI
jgi:serine/threonine protein kinase